jgi:YD repeat-containing protein
VKRTTNVDIGIEDTGDSSLAWRTTYSGTFSPKRNHTTNVHMQSYFTDCSGCTPVEPNSFTYMQAYIIGPGTDSVVFSKIMRTYGDLIFPANLDSGKTYVLKLRIRGMENAATLAIAYDTAATAIYDSVNAIAGGVRVKQIRNYDSVTGNAVNKFYRYTPVYSDFSSAVSTYVVDYVTESEYQQRCICVYDPAECGSFITSYLSCKFLNLSSSSLAPLNLFDNNHLGYQSILELDDQNGAKGFVQHEFSVYSVMPVEQLYGYSMINLPTNTLSTTSGYETRTAYYDSSRVLLKETLNYYNLHEDVFHKPYVAIAARKKFEPTIFIGGAELKIQAFDAARYTYLSDWVRQDSVTERTYDGYGNAMTNNTYYSYGSPANILPSSVATLSSKRDSVIKIFKYPTDRSTDTPYYRMTEKNIIDRSVEEQTLVNGTQVARSITEYYDWFGNGTSIQPRYLKTQKKAADSIRGRAEFYSYDGSGNILDMSKQNDLHLSYLWDYHSAFPTAEVSNADYSSIACTSFEADGHGNWDYASAGDTLAFGSVTGRKSYALAVGNVERTGLSSSQTYTITYWVKDGSGSVAINSGSQGTGLISRHGWTLYQRNVTGISSVVISGNAVIDELRLYPSKAQVNTLTYEPLAGVTSRCDANNRITYYEYDRFNRLLRIRDQDLNILKTYDYRYREPQ